MCGLEVAYDLLIPKAEGLEFDALFARCEAQGYNGLNITLPYKIRVMPKLEFPDATILQVGSSNTVVFGGARPLGYNTDYTGFMAAYRNRFAGTLPGSVAVAGAGGAGRAVAFALAKLGSKRDQALRRQTRDVRGAGRQPYANVFEAGRACLRFHR